MTELELEEKYKADIDRAMTTLLEMENCDQRIRRFIRLIECRNTDEEIEADKIRWENFEAAAAEPMWRKWVYRIVRLPRFVLPEWLLSYWYKLISYPICFVNRKLK